MVLRDLHPLPKTDKNGSATAARLAHWSRLASNVEESAREIHMRLVQNIILGVETFSERKKDRGSSCGITLGSATLVTAIAECLIGLPQEITSGLVMVLRREWCLKFVT